MLMNDFICKSYCYSDRKYTKFLLLSNSFIKKVMVYVSIFFAVWRIMLIFEA